MMLMIIMTLHIHPPQSPKNVQEWMVVVVVVVMCVCVLVRACVHACVCVCVCVCVCLAVSATERVLSSQFPRTFAELQFLRYFPVILLKC